MKALTKEQLTELEEKHIPLEMLMQKRKVLDMLVEADTQKFMALSAPEQKSYLFEFILDFHHATCGKKFHTQLAWFLSAWLDDKGRRILLSIPGAKGITSCMTHLMISCDEVMRGTSEQVKMEVSMRMITTLLVDALSSLLDARTLKECHIETLVFLVHPNSLHKWMREGRKVDISYPEFMAAYDGMKIDLKYLNGLTASCFQPA